MSALSTGSNFSTESQIRSRQDLGPCLPGILHCCRALTCVKNKTTARALTVNLGHGRSRAWLRSSGNNKKIPMTMEAKKRGSHPQHLHSSCSIASMRVLRILPCDSDPLWLERSTERTQEARLQYPQAWQTQAEQRVPPVIDLSSVLPCFYLFGPNIQA